MSAPNRRSVWLLAAILVALSLTGLACTSGASSPATHSPTSQPAASQSATSQPAASQSAASPAASPSPSPSTTIAARTTSTRTYSLKAGGLTRQYEVITPGQLSASAPVIVVLSGIGATLDKEIPRDELLPYVTQGAAELVYPVAIGQSWNAIGCCQYASAHNIPDMAFLAALAAKVDPGHTRPVDLVGYSNGARMLYHVACTDPALFDEYAAVKGGPLAGCVVKQPVSLVQLASIDDPEMPYAHGGQKRGDIPVLTEMANLRTVAKCTAATTVAHSGTVTLTEWPHCVNGARLQLAAWTGGKHSFPRPPVSVPSGAQVIWAFFTNTQLAALPS